MATYSQHAFRQMSMLRDVLVVTMFFKKEYGMLPYTFAFILDLVNIVMVRENMLFTEAVKIQRLQQWQSASGLPEMPMTLLQRCPLLVRRLSMTFYCSFVLFFS